MHISDGIAAEIKKNVGFFILFYFLLFENGASKGQIHEKNVENKPKCYIRSTALTAGTRLVAFNGQTFPICPW